MQKLKPEWEQRRSEKLAFFCARPLPAHRLISFFEGVSFLEPFSPQEQARRLGRSNGCGEGGLLGDGKEFLEEKNPDLEKNDGS